MAFTSNMHFAARQQPLRYAAHAVLVQADGLISIPMKAASPYVQDLVGLLTDKTIFIIIAPCLPASAGKQFPGNFRGAVFLF